MDEAPNFQMKIVREKRRSRRSRSGDPAAERSGAARQPAETLPAERAAGQPAADHAAGQPAAERAAREDHGSGHSEGAAQKAGGSGRSRSGRRGAASGSRHHRRYADYGTVDLGAMPDTSEGGRRPERTEGVEQREFLEKYSPVLDRKYRGRGSGVRSWALIVCAVLAALVLIYFVFFRPPAESDAAPAVETIPVVDIDEIG